MQLSSFEELNLMMNFKSHSCIPVDCPEDLRLPVRHLSVRNKGEML